jgi:Tfp pilus assembly protein PilF
MLSVKSTDKKQKITAGWSQQKLLLVIAVFSFLLYANSIPNGYNIDDNLVTINHQLTSKGIKAIPEIFTTPYYKDAAGNQYEYRPVTLTTFAIEHQVFGDNAHVSHLINTLIFVLLSLVLYITLSKLFSSYNYLLPLLITLLFVAHPIHTEAVTSIKNRDEILCLLGGLLALYHSLLLNEKNQLKNYLLFIFFFAFALLSKKSILPFILLIPLSHVVFRQTTFLRLFLISLPLSVCAAFFWPLDNIFQRIGFTLIPVVIPQAVYIILYRRELILKPVSDFYKSIRDITFITNNDLPESKGLNGYKLQWILLPASFVCGVLCCYYDVKVIIVLYLFFLSLVFLISSPNTRVGIFYDILLFVSIVSYFYQGMYLMMMLYTAALALFFNGTKKLKEIIPIAVTLILIGLFKFKGYKVNYQLLVLVPIVFYLFFEINKKLIALFLIAVAITLNLIFTFKINMGLGFYVVSITILIFLYFFPKQEKNSASFFFILALVPVLLLHFAMEWNRLPQNEVLYNTNEEFQKARMSIEKVKVIPASGRNLDFVEMPLRNSDPLSIKVGTSFIVLGKYIQLLLIPHNLGFYYGYAQIEPTDWKNFASILSITLHLFLVLSFFYFFRKHPILSYGIFFYLICISEFSNLLVQVAGLMADRLAFVASLGFCIAVSYSLLMFSGMDIKSHKLQLNFSNKWILVTILILVLYSAKTFSRNFQWKDEVTLMRHDVKHLDKSVQANNLLAFHLVERSFKSKNQLEKENYLNEAITHFKRAVELYPKADFAWHDLGQTYLLLNNLSAALPAFLKAVEIDSTYVNALMKAGGIYSKMNNHEEAAHYFERAIRNDSLNIQAYSSLSQEYFIQKNYQKAIDVNLNALKIAPGAFDLLSNTGKIYFAIDDKIKALEYFEKAYKQNSEDANLVFVMANIYKELGDIEKANFYFSKANKLKH